MSRAIRNFLRMRRIEKAQAFCRRCTMLYAGCWLILQVVREGMVR